MRSSERNGDSIPYESKFVRHTRIWGNILSVAASLILGLIGTLKTVSSEINISSGIWSLIEIVAAAAGVLVIFVSILKREPSKAVQLKKKLIAIYVGHLSDSVRESATQGKI